MTSTSPSESIESIADRYVIEDLLGRGGMGAVYRARDRRDGREVALKRLNAQASANRVVAELFEREFHTLSELAHPRIIEVYDYGVGDDGAYYSMELLAGQDLRELGKVHWQKACELLRDVASSLAILHSRRLLHRDVSLRNVRCTLDGRAKLLDFGAMVPMGVTQRVVGTPPFMAPEMLQLQALDGRADLFALGALAYWLLTGRHAYPAQQVGQLRDVWRRRLIAPRTIEPEVPQALSELVIELLQLNRNARPRSAGVVMERLCAIGGLRFEEAGDVARAYLTTPTLVGRDEPLARVRAALLGAMRGHGTIAVVKGPGGSGRSRFLDACVLEAKLLGSHVVRLGRSAGEQGNFAGAADLCRQLFELAPEVARKAAQLHGPVLAQLIGAELAGAQPMEGVAERRTLLLALRDFTLSVARSLRLMIAVDDVDRLDEASASLLMSIARKLRRRSLCLVLTMDSEGEGSAALDLLSEIAEKVELAPLSETQTEQLLTSVFGEANHLLTIARRMHAIAKGNPRAIMQLSAHLVDQGIARYESGSFVLPERLNEDDLPRSIGAALERRMAMLDADALELARVLALTDPSQLLPASYVELTAHADRARTYHAIDQLVRMQVLEPQGERYRFSDETWRAVLCGAFDPSQRVALHARLARVFEQGGTITRRSFHLMESEQPEAAIRLMLAQYLKDPNEPHDPLADYVPGLVELIERAATAAQALGLPAPLRFELRMKLAGASQYLWDIPRFARIAPPLLAELERDSGLLDYNALDPGMDAKARLTEAFARVQQRYQSTPEVERGLVLADAIRELARLCSMFIGMGMLDGGLLERMPSLEPFVPLSPAVAAIQQFIDGMRALAQGRNPRACRILLALIERLEAPDGAGLGQLYSKSIRMGALYTVGLAEAVSGIPSASKRVAELEREAGHRVNAQRVHMACYLMQGNVEAAAAAQRRAELVMLEDGQQQRYPGLTARTELFAYWLSHDLAGMKQLSERLIEQVAKLPSWEVLLQLSRCLYRQLQGDHAGALAALEPALAATEPLRSRDWAWVAAAQVQVLVELGRAEEAVEIGRAQMERCKEYELAGYDRVAEATAQALIAAGRPADAASLAEALITGALECGARGLVLGVLYEVRARAAIALLDKASYRDYAARCATEYRSDRNPALAARYQRVVSEAEQHGLSDLSQSVKPSPESGAVQEAPASFVSTVQSGLLECADANARALYVLTVVARHMNAECGYLYGLRAGRVELLCALPDADPPPGLQVVVEHHLQLELGAETATVFAPASIEHAAAELTTASSAFSIEFGGAPMHAVLLLSNSGGESVIAGIAVLRTHELTRRPSSELIDMLASALLEHDDVDPATCVI